MSWIRWEYLDYLLLVLGLLMRSNSQRCNHEFTSCLIVPLWSHPKLHFNDLMFTYLCHYSWSQMMSESHHLPSMGPSHPCCWSICSRRISKMCDLRYPQDASRHGSQFHISHCYIFTHCYFDWQKSPGIGRSWCKDVSWPRHSFQYGGVQHVLLEESSGNSLLIFGFMPAYYLGRTPWKCSIFLSRYRIEYFDRTLMSFAMCCPSDFENLWARSHYMSR